MENGIRAGNSPISSNTDGAPGACPLCGSDDVICNGLGVIHYDVPLDDERFGKLFRCPSFPASLDLQRQEAVRKFSNLAFHSDRTFANFDTGLKLPMAERNSLEMAYSVAFSFAQEPVGWLLLEGTYGCGKTHLAAAVGNYRLAKGDLVLFVTAPDLLDHLRSTYGPTPEASYEETFERFRSAPLVILDDLGVENPSPWAQEKLFQLLNHRYSARLPTVVTTNADLDNLDERVRSRLLDTNLIRRVRISAPDYRSSVQNERKQLASNLKLYSAMTFDTFDTHGQLLPEERKNLQKALRIAQAYAETPKDWLVFIGTYGCGKTHLAAAIAHSLQARGVNVMFLTAPDLLDHLRVTFSPESNVTFDARFHAVRNAPFVVLDDLGMESATPWAKEKMHQLLDHRYITELPTVITTAREIESFDGHIQSRILDERRCTVFGIETPSYSVRQRRRNQRGSR